MSSCAAPDSVRTHFRQLGREWVRQHPDPQRDAEVTGLLRSVRRNRLKRDDPPER